MLPGSFLDGSNTSEFNMFFLCLPEPKVRLRRIGVVYSHSIFYEYSNGSDSLHHPFLGRSLPPDRGQQELTSRTHALSPVPIPLKLNY